MHYSATFRSAWRAASFRLRHTTARLGVASALVVVLAAAGYTPHRTPQTAVHSAPSEISPADQEAVHRSLYAGIFNAQEMGDFTHADQLIAQLSDDRLLGTVLAQRYLHPDYKASAPELRDWLQNYADLPQSRDVYALAEKRGVATSVLKQVKLPEAPLTGSGNVAQLGRETMPDNWYHALQLWRARDYGPAAQSFAAIANNENLNDWHRAAGAYWAYRSYNKLGESSAARASLAQAASYPETFYGILATSQRGERLAFNARMPEIPDAIWNDPAVQRAQLLSAIDRGDDAEDELRQRFSTADKNERAALVSVAAKLSLPNLQLRLARSANLSDAEALAARYPTPEPMLNAQQKIDPALLLSVAMHESAFRESVRSGGGAVGMMQMLPSTAKRVALHEPDLALANTASLGDAALSIHDRLNDMAMSTRLGATYFTILQREPAVGRNMIRLLAAYNAGPGTVKGWQTAAKNINDPLLYLESIPYPETHNYVVQVMAHTWMYQAMLGEPTTSLHQLTRGGWPMLGA